MDLKKIYLDVCNYLQNVDNSSQYIGLSQLDIKKNQDKTLYKNNYPENLFKLNKFKPNQTMSILDKYA